MAEVELIDVVTRIVDRDRAGLLLAADAAEALGHRDEAAQWRAFANRGTS